MDEKHLPLHSTELTLDAVVEEISRSYIREILNNKSGNITAAADTLGLSRQGLYKKMKRLGMERE